MKNASSCLYLPWLCFQGLADETRNPFKLVLHCIMILTSVIPPELPIELSLAVINSLTSLTKSLIYCTEPFRIPLAGKVDVCCFDKTGTLTSDNLIMKGVAGVPAALDVGDAQAEAEEGADGQKPPPTAPAKDVLSAGVLGEVPTRILAGCHSVVTLNGSLVGDSVEVSTLRGLEWACLRGGVVVPRAGAKAARAQAASVAAGAGGAVRDSSARGADPALLPIQIVRAWGFDPSLRRMSTAIRLVSEMAGTEGSPGVGGSSPGEASRGGGGSDVPPFHDRLWVVTKGGPESLEPLLTDAPPNYRSTFLHHMGQGSRVLALGYRALEPSVTVERCRRMGRGEAERGLRFGGFLVLGCPLKPDAPYVVRGLRESSHAVAMITGDSVLTAVDVARQVGMIDQPPARTLTLSVVEGELESTRNAGADSEVRGTEEAGVGSGNVPGTAKKGEDPGSGDSSGGVGGDVSLRWLPLTRGLDGSVGAVCGGGARGGGGNGPEQGDGDGGGGGDGGVPFDPDALPALAKKHALCVTGDVLNVVSALSARAVHAASSKTTPGGAAGVELPKAPSSSAVDTAAGQHSALSALCCHVAVFARVSPSQKEQVIGELNSAARTTLMCGDGTNDVGALRLAHVGVSIVNSPELEKRLAALVGQDGDGGERGSGTGKKGQRSSDARRSRMLATLEREEHEQDPALVKLGDASIASPFTAKTTSVGCVLSIIREGRCTLVTTLQVYKAGSTRVVAWGA